jgi:hypothetical protein
VRSFYWHQGVSPRVALSIEQRRRFVGTMAGRRPEETTLYQ